MRAGLGKRPDFVPRYDKIEQNQSRIKTREPTNVLSESHCPSRFGVEPLRDLAMMREPRQIKRMHQELEAEGHFFQQRLPGKSEIPRNFLLKSPGEKTHEFIHAAFFQAFQAVFKRKLLQRVRISDFTNRRSVPQSRSQVENRFESVGIQTEIGHGVWAHCDSIVFGSVVEALPQMEEISDRELPLCKNVLERCR
jgi:hypothetical protein